MGIEERCYPVDCLYLEELTEDYVEKSAQTAFDIHLGMNGAGCCGWGCEG